MKGTEFENTEALCVLVNRLPEAAKPILKIYCDETRPWDYIEKYGDGTPKASHISEYLGLSKVEVKRLIKIIRIHYVVMTAGY